MCPTSSSKMKTAFWCGSATLRQGVAAFGYGPTQEAAIADLREGLELLLEEVGIPDELTVTLNVA